MIIRATDSGRLYKFSTVSWADVDGQTPIVDSGDWFSFGLLYYSIYNPVPPGGTFSLWGHYQSFIRFDDSAFAGSSRIMGAELRLYPYIVPASAITFRVLVLDSTYGAVDTTDWNAAGVAQSFNSEDVLETDADGNRYLALTLNSAQIAAIPTNGEALDIRLGASSDTPPEPTELEYFVCSSHQYADETLRPVLVLTTAPALSCREEILAGLKTRLATIDEYGGYTMTPSIVSRRPLDFATLEATRFPAVYLDPQSDASEGGTLGMKACKWRINVQVGVYHNDPNKIDARLEAFISDVRRALETDIGVADPLGLDFVNEIKMSTFDKYPTAIDSNRATATLGIDVDYFRGYGTA